VTIVDGVTFPVGPWIPDTGIVNDIGTDLLTVVGASLDLFGYGVRYERRFVGHGTEAAIEPSKANQLTIVWSDMYLGRAGEKQFQFAKGALGKFAFAVAEYDIEITQPYPKRQGREAIRTTDIAAHRANLWRDSYIVWAGLVALANGGLTPPSGGALAKVQRQDNGVMVGEIGMKGPAGGEASVVIKVGVQLPT
jgi:hypothetical protein